MSKRKNKSVKTEPEIPAVSEHQMETATVAATVEGVSVDTVTSIESILIAEAAKPEPLVVATGCPHALVGPSRSRPKRHCLACGKEM